MASKSGGESRAASGSGLLDAVRTSIATSRPGFRPWHERIDPEVAVELEELRREWRAGKLGAKLRPVAAAIVTYLHEHNLSDIGIQGVSRWLEKQD